MHGCDSSVVDGLFGKADAPGHYAAVPDPTSLRTHHTRQGAPVVLPFAQSEFVDVISLRAKRPGSAGELEGHALLLAVEYVARAANRHRKHVLFTVDAQAVLYVALKGRSSSPSLGFIFRRLGALVSATGIHPHYLWIPSEHNPADRPSRGLRRRPLWRRALRPHRPSAVEKQYLEWLARIDRLAETGMLDLGPSDTDGDSSSIGPADPPL